MAIKEPEKYPFRTDFKVRDYECDLQGIVNHANYIHYCEHARHEALLQLGGSFGKMHDEGEDLVVAKLNIEYAVSLRSGDEFYVLTGFRREGPRLVCTQKISRTRDDVKAVIAEVHAVLVKDGKLTRASEFFDRLIIRSKEIGE